MVDDGQVNRASGPSRRQHGAAVPGAASLEAPIDDRDTTLRRVLLALLALAAIYFVLRGPIRPWAGMDDRDLTVFFTATRAWIEGSSPYDQPALGELARSLGIQQPPTWSVNPPTTFPLLAPLALLAWPIASKVSIVLNVLLTLASLRMALSLAGLGAREPRGLALLAFGLALAPFHTAISEGQLSIAVTALVLGSLLAMRHDRPVMAGVAVAMAAALKPQMGLVFLVLLLFRGRWRAWLSGTAALGVLAVIGGGRLSLAGVDWLPDLLDNIAASPAGDLSGVSAQRLNLPTLLHVLAPESREPVLELVTLAAAGVALAVLLLGLRGRRDREAELLACAGGAVITLLAIYNRSYGATLLILPLAWALAAFRPHRLAPFAAVVGAACAVFLVPGAAALARPGLPADLQWVTGTPWWPWLQVHQIIALLVVLGALLLAATWGSRRGADDGDEPMPVPPPGLSVASGD